MSSVYRSRRAVYHNQSNRERLWSRNLRTALGMEPIDTHALMAQLVVLYEDLRIELFSATDYSEETDAANYRRMYLIRQR